MFTECLRISDSQRGYPIWHHRTEERREGQHTHDLVSSFILTGVTSYHSERNSLSHYECVYIRVDAHRLVCLLYTSLHCTAHTRTPPYLFSRWQFTEQRTHATRRLLHSSVYTLHSMTKMLQGNSLRVKVAKRQNKNWRRKRTIQAHAHVMIACS